MVIGARSAARPEPRRAPLGNAVFQALASLAHGPAHPRPHLGLPGRAARPAARDPAPAAQRLLLPHHLLPRLPEGGHNVAFVPDHRAAARRARARSGCSATASRFLLIIFKIVTLYSPLKVFFPIAAVVVPRSGLAYGIWNVARPRQDPDGRGAAHPARGGRVPLRPHLGADRVGPGPEVSRRRARRDVVLAPPPGRSCPPWPTPRPGRRSGSLGPGDGAALHYPLRARGLGELRARRAAGVEPDHLLGHAAARGLSAGRSSTRSCPLLALPSALRRLPDPGPPVPRRLRRPRLPLSAAAGRGARGRLRGRALLRPRPLPRRAISATRPRWWRRRCCPSCCWPPRTTCGGRRARARGRPRRQPRPPPPGRLAGGGARGSARSSPAASWSATC